jgi:Nuclease A inhibitor-like protein
MKNFDVLLDKIRNSCEGLDYISETDAPVTVFVGQQAVGVTHDIVLQQTNSAQDTQVEERSFDDFFHRLTTVFEGYGEREKESASKFLQLKELLEENLRELKVFKLGRIRLDIYVVGLSEDGRLVGVTMKAVET